MFHVFVWLVDFTGTNDGLCMQKDTSASSFGNSFSQVSSFLFHAPSLQICMPAHDACQRTEAHEWQGEGDAGRGGRHTCPFLPRKVVCAQTGGRGQQVHALRSRPGAIYNLLEKQSNRLINLFVAAGPVRNAL